MRNALARLATLALVAALGWSAYWWVAAEGQRRALHAWFDGRARAGWQADRAGIAVTGYPLAFARRVDAPALADPRAGWAWAAPWVGATSDALAPNRLAITFPPTQTLAIPGATARLTSAHLAADLAITARLGLITAGVAGRTLALDGPPGWQAAAASLTARVAQRSPGSGPPNAYDLDLDAQAIRLPPALLARLDPTGRLAPQADRLVLDAVLALDAPLDLAALESGRLHPRSLLISQAVLGWGAMEVTLQGRLDLDAAGFPQGRLAVAARNWRQMVALARRSGALTATDADLLTTALTLAALLTGGESVRVTLTLAKGRIGLGPIPFAALPRLGPPAP